MKPGGRKGESAGSEAGDKEKWPARPPGAQPAGEPGQDGRWGPEEGAQKPGDKIRAVFFAGYQGQPPLAGGAGAPARPCKSTGAREQAQGRRRIKPTKATSPPISDATTIANCAGAPARPCKSFGARKKDQKPRRINPQRKQARPLATQRPLRTARGAGAPLQVFWGEEKRPETPSHKPTKEASPQTYEKKEGKQQLPSVQ